MPSPQQLPPSLGLALWRLSGVPPLPAHPSSLQMLFLVLRVHFLGAPLFIHSADTEHTLHTRQGTQWGRDGRAGPPLRNFQSSGRVRTKGHSKGHSEYAATEWDLSQLGARVPRGFQRSGALLRERGGQSEPRRRAVGWSRGMTGLDVHGFPSRHSRNHAGSTQEGRYHGDALMQA